MLRAGDGKDHGRPADDLGVPAAPDPPPNEWIHAKTIHLRLLSYGYRL
jgi:hypothetical protein